MTWSKVWVTTRCFTNHARTSRRRSSKLLFVIHRYDFCRLIIVYGIALHLSMYVLCLFDMFRRSS